MSVDWQNALESIGGGGLVALIAWLLGRTDKAQETRFKADVAKLREEKIFVETLEQNKVNEFLQQEVGEIKETVKGVDQKLDRILLSGRIPIK